jgi:hypothetical protein
MSENDHKKRTHDDSDGHESDSKDRSYKRVAVQGGDTDSPERPQHRRRDDEDGKKIAIGYLENQGSFRFQVNGT